METAAAMVDAAGQVVTAHAPATDLTCLARDVTGATVRLLIEIGADIAAAAERAVVAQAFPTLRQWLRAADTVGADRFFTEIAVNVARLVAGAAMRGIALKIDTTPIAAGQPVATGSIALAGTPIDPTTLVIITALVRRATLIAAPRLVRSTDAAARLPIEDSPRPAGRDTAACATGLTLIAGESTVTAVIDITLRIVATAVAIEFAAGAGAAFGRRIAPPGTALAMIATESFRPAAVLRAGQPVQAQPTDERPAGAAECGKDHGPARGCGRHRARECIESLPVHRPAPLAVRLKTRSTQARDTFRSGRPSTSVGFATYGMSWRGACQLLRCKENSTLYVRTGEPIRSSPPPIQGRFNRP